MGILELPPKKTVQPPSTGQVTLPHITSQRLSDYDLTTPITSLPDDVHIEIAKGNGAERLWNKLVDKHHYLGHKIIVGRCIKYLVKAGSNLLGALAFSSPAWRLSARDSFLRSIGIDQDDVPDLVINNCRFLILPHVEVINLASMALSMATRQVVKDWEEYYSLKPLVAETFVEQNKFKGTCYKAANWIAIGSTKGYEKKGRSHHNSQTPKIIYLYGLNRGIRGKIIRVYHDKIDCSS